MIYEKKDKHFRIRFCNSLIEFLPKMIFSKVEKVKIRNRIFNRVNIEMINIFSHGKISLKLKEIGESQNVYIKHPRNTEDGCVLNFNRFGENLETEMQILTLHFAEADVYEKIQLVLRAEVTFEHSNKDQTVAFDLVLDIGNVETLFTPVTRPQFNR